MGFKQKTFLESDLEQLRKDYLSMKCLKAKDLKTDESYLIVVHAESFIKANLRDYKEDSPNLPESEAATLTSQFIEIRLNNPLLYYEVEKMEHGFAYYACIIDFIYDRGKGYNCIKDYSFTQLENSVKVSMSSITYGHQWWVLPI